MIENGTYKARAVHGSASLGYTSKGNEQVAVRLRITEGEYENQTLVWHGFFTEKTEDRTLESLRYLGWRGDDLFDLSSVGDDQAEDAEIVVEQESDDEGKMRARVRWINQGSRVLLKEQMNDAQAREFSARMKGKILSMKQRPGAPKNNTDVAPKRAPVGRTRHEAPPPSEDDDIPF